MPRQTDHRRHWGRLAARAVRLYFGQTASTDDLVRMSYDHIAHGYDQAWTTHMRHLSVAMLDRLAVPTGGRCLDLTCGTGFVTGELARRGGGEVLGVDASAGMLEQARRQHPQCRFIESDAVEFLRRQEAGSFDLVTCAWGLGYTRPFTLLRQISRVLKAGGQVGLIDNSLFSVAEVLWSAMLTFAERPTALRHVMKFRFLPTGSMLAGMLRLTGLSVTWRSSGAKEYLAADGPSAIDRLTATGAAAGFEYATDEANREWIFRRFAEVFGQRFGRPDGVPIVHRYIAAIGAKS